MEENGFEQPVDAGAQGKSKKTLIVPILSIVLGISVLIWWLSSWLVVDSMGWGMCLAVMLPGLGGAILVLLGVGLLIRRAFAGDPEAE